MKGRSWQGHIIVLTKYIKKEISMGYIFNFINLLKFGPIKYENFVYIPIHISWQTAIYHSEHFSENTLQRITIWPWMLVIQQSKAETTAAVALLVCSSFEGLSWTLEAFYLLLRKAQLSCHGFEGSIFTWPYIISNFILWHHGDFCDFGRFCKNLVKDPGFEGSIFTWPYTSPISVLQILSPHCVLIFNKK